MNRGVPEAFNYDQLHLLSGEQVHCVLSCLGGQEQVPAGLQLALQLSGGVSDANQQSEWFVPARPGLHPRVAMRRALPLWQSPSIPNSLFTVQLSFHFQGLESKANNVYFLQE